MRRLETPLVVLVVVLITIGTVFFSDGLEQGVSAPTTLWQGVGVAALAVAALSLVVWRRHPAWTLALGTTGTLVCALTGPEVASGPAVSSLTLAILPSFTCLAAYSWSGRTGIAIGLALLVWLEALYLATGESGPSLAMFTVPGYAAGFVLRRLQEKTTQLEIRSRELEEERELFAELTVRNERARIAAELHDIIGHALSVMVVQAAAGQRLAGHDAAATTEAFAVIADSARQGREDLGRLVDLLDGEAVVAPDLSLIDEVVASAARSGLAVTCRFEGDRDSIPTPLAHVMFRVVQEGLTNALKHAPGAAVHVLVRSATDGLTVSVRNEPPGSTSPQIRGSGVGLQGLRERLQRLGGTLVAGAAPQGGWSLEARLPRG